MRTYRPARSVRDRSRSDPATRSEVLVVSNQGDDAIRRRREIREAFHDAKALTIKAKHR